MKLSDKDQYIIKKCEEDEQMMVFIFAQFCVNHGLDAIELYKKAYPNQQDNNMLKKALENTVPKKESEDISLEIVLYMLDMYGNHDLAFMIQEEAASKK